MAATELAEKTCKPCSGDTPPLDRADAERMLGDLDGWQLADDGKSIHRKFEFKGFAKAVEMANLAAFVGNHQGHHPDITFGYGYCDVTYTTHAAKGLTENDFICAARMDAALA